MSDRRVVALSAVLMMLAGCTSGAGAVSSTISGTSNSSSTSTSDSPSGSPSASAAASGTADSADPVEASLLGVDTGLPILLVHRTARDNTGRPVEWTRSVFRGDRFRFVARHGASNGASNSV